MSETKFQLARSATQSYLKRTHSIFKSGGDDFVPFLTALADKVRVGERKLTLALAGEYTVGKSSLIKALTGFDVPIGAGVTTSEVKGYEYRGLMLVDMPGTLSGQMQHDELAKRAITDADLILFVVSNELFNPLSLQYFKLAADGVAKKKQMLLVVNKLDRFNAAGKTLDQVAEFIAGVLAEQIRPLPITDFGPVVISARDHLSASDQADVKKRERRVQSSRFTSLVRAIDDFTEARGLIAQELQPLQHMLSIIDAATTTALSDDGSRERTETLLRRRAFALREERARAVLELTKLRTTARGDILRPTEKILKLVEQRPSQEEIDAEAHRAEVELERVVKNTGDEARALNERLVSELHQRLDEIDASPLAQLVEKEFNAEFDRPDMTGLAGGLSPKARKALMAQLKSGAGFLAQNSEHAAAGLAKIFKFFGGKFKPYGKIKLGEFVGKAGAVLGPIVAIGETYMNYRAEQEAEEAERQLRGIRADLRAQFSDAASQFEQALREREVEVLRLLYDEQLASTAEVVQELLDGAAGKAAVGKDLARLSHELRSFMDSLLS